MEHDRPPEAGGRSQAMRILVNEQIVGRDQRRHPAAAGQGWQRNAPPPARASAVSSPSGPDRRRLAPGVNTRCHTGTDRFPASASRRQHGGVLQVAPRDSVSTVPGSIPDGFRE